MTQEQEPQERTEEDKREARLNSYRSVANGLIIHASRFLGTFDISDLDPRLLSEWVGLATELHSEADSADPAILEQHRKAYLETITRATE